LSEFYSKLYWTLQYFFTTLFPKKYSLEISHLVNSIFSISAIIGFLRFFEICFFKNKKLSKILFIIIFFYPIIFGHMGINPKDTIVLFCNTWSSYLIKKFFKKKKKKIDSKFIILFSLLFSMGTGVQFYFIGTLLPILTYIFINLLLKKDLFKKDLFSFLFFIEFFLVFFFIIFFLLLFWPETHSNIFYLPINFILENSSIRGYGLNMINGIIINKDEFPILYFYIFFFYQSPEYILFLFFLFFLFFIKKIFEKFFFFIFFNIFFFFFFLFFSFFFFIFF